MGIPVHAVAKAHNLTVLELWDRIDAGELPGPDELQGPALVPMWDQETVDNPVPRARGRRKQAKMTRQEHLLNLFDEAVYWVLNNNGETRIPVHAVGRPDFTGRPFDLGHRVTALRTWYNQGRLSADEVAMFERIYGWQWDPLEEQWRQRLHEVATRPYDELTKDDLRWLATQRVRYSTMSEERRAELAKYPGVLEPPTKATLFARAAKQWLEEHPGLDIADLAVKDTTVIDGKPYPLLRRAQYYRRRYRGEEGTHPLTARELALIEELPGWTWEDPGPNQWDWRVRQTIAAARQWLQENPDTPITEVPADERVVMPDGVPVMLGERLDGYRRNHKDKLRRKARAALEELPGWTWQVD